MNKKQKIIGFWKRKGRKGFTSSPICYKDSETPVRMLLMKNPYPDKEKNRPDYIAYLSRDIEFSELEEADFGGDRFYYDDKLNKLAEIMREGKRNGDVMALPSESAANAQKLYRDAVEIVEELTGEKWEFSFITYY